MEPPFSRRTLQLASDSRFQDIAECWRLQSRGHPFICQSVHCGKIERFVATLGRVEVAFAVSVIGLFAPQECDDARPTTDRPVAPPVLCTSAFLPVRIEISLRRFGSESVSCIHVKERTARLNIPFFRSCVKAIYATRFCFDWRMYGKRYCMYTASRTMRMRGRSSRRMFFRPRRW